MSEVAVRPNTAALVPSTAREAMELATMMAKAGFLAKELQTTGGALFVIEQATRWNMSPFAVAMETSFIQGKPMFSGKIVAAACVSSGALSGRFSYSYSGSGDNRTVVVSGVIRGETAPREVTVRLGDAKTANKFWLTQPDQQLAYHGARVWARRYTPEVMLGVMAPEEFDLDATPPPPRDVPNLAAEPPAPPAPREEGWPIVSPDGEALSVPRGRWLAAVGKALGRLESLAALRAWGEAMTAALVAVAERDDLAAAEAERMIADRLAEFATAEEEEA